MGELSTMTMSFRSLPSRLRSLTKEVLIKVQCSLKRRKGQYPFLSMISRRGSAYLERLAVKITISYLEDIFSRNSFTPGRTRTWMSCISFSSSILIITSEGHSKGKKPEWTKVSSRSRINVFL